VGRLDVENARALRECVDQAFAEDPREFVLDLSGVTSIDSSGLATIVDASRRARNRGIEFGIVPGNGKVRQVLRMTRIDSLLRLIG
jgi:anti-sigma B factor antagonist